MPPMLLGVGPATIGVIGPHTGAVPDAMVVAVLDSLDDPVALLDDRVVGVDELLVTVLAEALGPHCAAATVVHPTWWPRRRVERVRAAAAVTADAVTTVSRSELLRHRGGDPVVVEIATDRVAVCRRGPVRVFGRHDYTGIASLIARRCGATTVLLDAPDAVSAAGDTAKGIRKALSDNGIAVDTADVYQPPRTVPSAEGRPRRPGVAAAAVVAAATVALTASAMWPENHRPDSVRLVEGRVAVQIPPGWPVRRVTDGPGSRRVEVTSPTDDGSAVHITAAYTPEGTLAEAAAVLERVAAAEPEVFGDFRADAEVAGRPALTYREVRPGRQVDWTVVLDGSMRIGIGCQSAPARDQSLGSACQAAIASARDIGNIGPQNPGGTAPAPGASN